MTTRKSKKVPPENMTAWAAREEEAPVPSDPTVPQILDDVITFVAGATVRDGYFHLDIHKGGEYALPRRDVLNLYGVCPTALPDNLRKRVELWNMGR